MKNIIPTLFILIFILTACAPASTPTMQAVPASPTSAPPKAIPSATPTPELPTFTPVPTFTAAPTETPTDTPLPVVESLSATVNADLLSCRYGPGAEYLYLYGYHKGDNIELIGRADGNNWVMVNLSAKSKCWVNAKYVDIQGDPMTLNTLYPDGYKLPVSPYYASPIILSAVRDPSDNARVTVTWSDIALRAGDEEDADMFIYIIEVWRCEGGKIIFDPLASNDPEVTFVDEAGCDVPSHGRVFFQEKHGYAGPAEIHLPAH